MEAERRQITVLFTDMVGFTTFSERSGEEAAYTLMRSLSKLMAEAVREQGGVVQNFTGDGIMAVFGAPTAYEDAPMRACRAALTILQRLKQTATNLEKKHGIRPQMRIGLNTGVAVVGRLEDGADAGVSVLGDTVNFAARLQALAESDSVLMSEATHRMVQGMAEASFAGEHQIKGKVDPQKVYRLNAVRVGATRFEAAINRGLSTFVGRERELNVLERGLEKARSELCVIDLVAEPGMGKSRLLHEFRQRIGKDSAFVLAGSCSPDGQQTPFLPFIEVVRGSFRVTAGEAEKDVARKLELGLTALGLNSLRSFGLLLHLLGLKAPEGSLTGLDGVLIGLRTRELLQQLLEARSRLSPVALLIEDLHWLDSVSAELLSKFIDGEAKLRLLILTTRRPEYAPLWLGHAAVTTLPLEPLPAADIRRLVQMRLGVESLPEALALRLAEKAEGNPLFAEEIVSFLTERGVIRAAAGKLDYDASVVAAALPASVQSLLTARVDRLDPKDRALLQAASVIGRQFDSDLLAAVTGESATDARLAAMQALDLIYRDSKSSDYLFKHALVRDALYQSLLSEPRKALHLRIAEEVERRGGNRLAEVVEALAHHYSQTDETGKAFVYLSMAGAKSLGVYSLDEAASHLSAGLALLDTHPGCASDDQVADFFIPYARLMSMTNQLKTLIAVLDRYLGRIDCLGDDPRVVLIRHHFVFALLWNTRFREADALQRETSRIADRLKDSRSLAYSLAGDIHVSSVIAAKPLDEFESLKRDAIKAAGDTADAYIRNWIRFVIGWEEFHRGRITEARASASELMEVGKLLHDPRSTGLGLALFTWVALVGDSYAEALEYSEQSLNVAVTPFDRDTAIHGKGVALVMLRQSEAGIRLLEEVLQRSVANGCLYRLSAIEGFIGIGKVLQGKISDGIGLLEREISRHEKAGYLVVVGWHRLFLGEVYLQIIAGGERPPLTILFLNLPILLIVMATAPSRIRDLMSHVMMNPRFDPAGHHIGHAQMILGLLYKAKKKRALALEHLSNAKRILCQFGETPILARVETALAELKK